MLVVSKKKSVLAILAIMILSLILTLTVFSTLVGAASLDEGVTDVPTADQTASHRLIVQLESPALAERADMSRSPDGALAVNSADAQAYIARLEAEQAVFVADMAQAIPGADVSSYINESGQSIAATYQVVFNGVVVDPGATPRDEARRLLEAMPGVKAVYLDHVHYPQTYASMPLINVQAIWDQVGGYENGGAGIKVASIDGGLHHAAPMFDGTGFDYPDGWPEGGLGDAANNNGKIIASRAYFREFDPPAVGDENTWPGENGTSHGVHTGSTAAGNRVVADYLGITETVSGVAPGAWVMSYRVFYASVNSDGSFHDAEGIAAIEDMVMDGADVVNNSWGGGPGSVGGALDPIDQALINASNAGVFVSMSAGNAGPGKGTGDHPSDDYISVAASTTDGTLASGRLNVTAPEPISPALQSMSYSGAGFGPGLPIGDILSYPFLTSASADPGNIEGCSAWPADTFTGYAAVISRGSCNFGNKVYFAQEAGAEFVIVYNNAGDGLINMSFACDYAPDCGADDISISSIFIGQTNGEGVVNWYNSHGAASELEIDTLAFQAGNVPDRIIGFSSRGPGVGNTLKPDIAAPGVNILAQGYAPGATGEARHLGFGQSSGTSMASPHVAGAAALLRQVHPDWSNAAIKSALMSTSKYMDIYIADGTTPAQPLDMGAGRLDLTNATDPGVILDPPSVGFGQVVDGDMSSMDVMVTNVADESETYDLSTLYTGAGFAVTQTTTLTGFMVSPISITLDPGESAVVTVDFDSSTSQGVGDNQGYVIMEGDNGHDAHFPVWARVVPAATNDVLIIDNDGSSSLGAPNYSAYYTSTLDALGVAYDVWDADPNFAQPATIPEAAELSKYKAIIYFTGDNFQPDGTFTVSTALTQIDMDRLTQYANDGGILIAMGQDLAAVWNSDSTNGGNFAYSSVLGADWLQDSVTQFVTPTLPIVPANGSPQAFNGISLDVGDPAASGGDGAGNQFFIDEIRSAPTEPESPPWENNVWALLQYPGSNNIENGYVAVAHRDQPSLERPGVTYYGRSIYTSFGLEGVNNGPDAITTREDLLQMFMDWAMDEPVVELEDITSDYSETGQMAVFKATLTSNITDTVGVSYRFDFGDGSSFTPATNIDTAGHDYDYCGNYTVRIEVTDSWGNRAVGSLETEVTANCTYQVFMPVIAR